MAHFQEIVIGNFVIVLVGLYYNWKAIAAQTLLIQAMFDKIEEQQEVHEELELGDKLEAIADEVSKLGGDLSALRTAIRGSSY